MGADYLRYQEPAYANAPKLRRRAERAVPGSLLRAANLPCASFAACQSADAKRTYKAFTIDIARRLSNKWMAHGSVTWNSWKEKVSNVAKGCVDPTNQVASFQSYFWAGPSQANGMACCPFGRCCNPATARKSAAPAIPMP